MQTSISLGTALFASLSLTMAAVAAPPRGFQMHARFTGIGGCLNQIVAPGPDPGSERLYASHIYGGDTLDIVATDPLTGQTEVFASPVPSECGAWALVKGPDDRVYVGTLPMAHVMVVDWAQKKLVDLGRPSDTESYIWQLAVGSDQKLYGCTYGNAKLVRFDSVTGQGEDLGRMSETENYARSVAADDKGFVYVGIGMSQQDLVAYEIATGRHQSILPADLAKPGCVSVHRGVNGAVYANAGRWLRCDGFNSPLEVPAADVSSPPPLVLRDGRGVVYDGRTVGVRQADGTVTSHETGYRGKSQSLFRIGLGPDGRLYGSTAMPIHFFWADPDSDQWEEIAVAGGGEFYSFLAWRDKLVGAAYSAPSPVMLYDPKKPWAPGPTAADNPWQVHYPGENGGWRPGAMVHGTDGKIYIGAISGYGLLGGPLCVYDPVQGTIEEYMHVVKDQSVWALAVLPNGLIVGGTTVGGGGGSHPTQTEAKLFLWSPKTRQKVFETVPVPGHGSIDALAVGRNGLVYGFAGDTMFVFSPREAKVIHTTPNPLGGVIYNAVGPGPEGKLYGLYGRGIFTIDEQSHEMRQVAEYPDGVGGGFAIRGRQIFFTSGPNVVSYTLPE